jgi:acyl transferase domain-containing protein
MTPGFDRANTENPFGAWLRADTNPTEYEECRMSWTDATGNTVPIAILGMAARAAGAPDLDRLWRLVESGESAIADLPSDRIPGFDHKRAGVDTVRAGLLDRIDAFDADFFDISPRQAAFMDPQQRLLLEETWHALEDAGISPDRIAGTDTGVFIGSGESTFRNRSLNLGVIDQYTTSGTMEAFLANRLSFWFDLHGSSMHVDTACSSSMTAVVQAVMALSTGLVPMAIVGGTSVICHGFEQEAFFKGGFLSRSGRVNSFGENADGYVRGEGVAVIVLKRLADAERDGDPIRAVIRGVAQGHDGRAGGQFLPDAGRQTELIRRATAHAGITPDALGYVEAHAPGTRLGDVAEANGLIGALNSAPAAAGPDGRLWVGSLKGNIGHTEGAAGLFGLIKATLVLEHGLIPPIPGFTRPLPDIPAADAPLGFPTGTVDWPSTDAGPRLAGVSSFGLGGSNAHVVLAEAPRPSADPSDGRADGGAGSRLFPLSAATPQALARLAARFADWLADHPAADLSAVAWTLQTGRRTLPCRAMLAGADATRLVAAAKAIAQNIGTPPVSADVPAEARDAIATFLADGTADWPALWSRPSGPPRRIPLVPYPFEEQSHWLRVESAPAPLPAREYAVVEKVDKEQPVTAHAAPAPAATAPVVPAQAATAPAVPARPATPLLSLRPPSRYVPTAPAPRPEERAAEQDRPAPDQPPIQEPVQPPIQTPVQAPSQAPDAGPVSSEAARFERLILDAVADVLYLAPGEIGPEEDFVSAGVDSILAAELVQLLRSQAGVDLEIERLHATRTARALARELAGDAPSPETAAVTAPAPEPPRHAGSGEPDDDAPEELREKLRQLAGDCLYVPSEKIDVAAEFTAIGLDSVLAVEFVSQINGAFDADLTVQTLHEHPTVGRLAAHLNRTTVRRPEGVAR